MTVPPTSDQAGSAEAPGSRPPTHGLIGPFTGRHLVILVATVAGVTALILVLFQPVGDPGRGSEVPAPGASFFLFGEEGTGLAVGQRPPELVNDAGAPLTDLDGQPVRLDDYIGRPVWIVFWASWCPPCQAETPDIQRAYEAYAGDGLEVIAINVEEPPEEIRAYAETYGLTYPIALDPDASVFRRFGVFGLPTHYFIGPDGIIRDRWFGPLTLASMNARIEAISQ